MRPKGEQSQHDCRLFAQGITPVVKETDQLFQ
jgi:hypothetical protein